MQTRGETINRILLAVVLVAFSLNLFLVIDESAAWINGWRVDYLLGKCYFGEIFLYPFLLWEGWRQKTQFFAWIQKNFAMFAAGVLIFCLNVVRAAAPMVALKQGITAAALLMFALIVRQKIKAEPKTRKLVWQTLVVLIIFESCLALCQFVRQKSLFPYSILGETNLESATDLAKVSFFGKSLVAPYGTMSHPNVLAGTLVLILAFLWREKDFIKRRRLSKIITGLVILIVLLVQSWTALIFLFLLWLAGKFSLEVSNKKMSACWFFFLTLLLIPLAIYGGAKIWPDNLSLTRRANLNMAAGQMWQTAPFLGVGVGQFTMNLQNFWPDNNFTQPVHNTIWLILTETGAIGLIGLTIVCWKNQLLTRVSRNWILVIAIAVFLALDHYVWTTWWGWLCWLIFL